MLKIELSFTDNHLVKKLLDYAIAADIQPHQLIEEARVFGKKLLQLITKHKLYASKRKGKSCMEYVKS